MVILLVDGDEQTRAMRAALLVMQGHDVLQAASAVEAVHFAQEAEQVDLLITEVILEDETFGFDLSEAIMARLPQMRTLFTTRFDLTGYEEELRGRTPLPQTASETEFLAAVNAALASPEAAPSGPALADDAPVMPPGTMLGHYQIIDRLYSEPQAETYRAIQFTVQRPVALVLLKPHLLTDAKAVAEFKDRERVKASLSHPRIAPLYEAGEANGWLYYTREQPPGRSLLEVATAGEQLNERVMVDVLYRVAEAMAYAVERGYGYRTLGTRDIYVDSENQTSIVNVFRPLAVLPRDQAADVQALIELLAPYAAQGKARSMLHDLSLQSHNWASLASSMHDIRDDLSERSLINRAKDEDIAVAAPPSKPWLVLGVAAAVLGVVLWLGVVSGGSSTAPAPKVNDEMVLIPKGPFTYQTGQKAKTTADFWMSKHEVTVAQYAEFLSALKKGSPTAYDDPKQPSSKTSHEPRGWAAFYSAASTNGSLNNQQVSLNSPVNNVDYWDAVAYAKWRKQRLPSEKEWEKAARGTDGRLYPWGNEPQPALANLGDDYAPKAHGGQIDGYNFWSPVDKPAGDESPYHVIGMAGNVQEWTASWETHPDYPLKLVPVLRGGHFGLKSSADLLTARHFADSPEESTPARGFRTVSDTAPGAPANP